jgi:hypothetical protein
MPDDTKNIPMKIVKLRGADLSENGDSSGIVTKVQSPEHLEEAIETTRKLAALTGIDLSRVEMLIDGGRFSFVSVVEAFERSQRAPSRNRLHH